MKNQITTNFTLDELTASTTAKKYNIDNTPSEEVYDNLVKLCKEVLQPIRDKYKKPITVTSGFRCKELNDKLKGSKTSQHMTGCAVDIDTPNNEVLFNLIISMLNNNEIEVSQCIDEKKYSWIHLGLYVGGKHNQVLHL